MKQAWKTGRIGIIGLGLIGTSFGMALKKNNPALLITGLTKSEKSGKTVLQMGAIDRLVHTVSELIAGTDIIVLSTPIRVTTTLLQHIGKLAQKPILITDTGSTKAEICAVAKKLPAHVAFIGGHPMAGKETSGPENADANLFAKRPWILIQESEGKEINLARIESLISATGAVPVSMTAPDHDRLAAAVSHLPLIISILLMETVAGQASWPALRQLTGNGFRDTTRLAAGNPAMHTDILRTNKENILSAVEQFDHALKTLKTDIASGHWLAIEEKLRMIQQARLSWERSQL